MSPKGFSVCKLPFTFCDAIFPNCFSFCTLPFTLCDAIYLPMASPSVNYLSHSVIQYFPKGFSVCMPPLILCDTNIPQIPLYIYTTSFTVCDTIYPPKCVCIYTTLTFCDTICVYLQRSICCVC